MLGFLGAAWGVGGVVLLIGSAVMRMTPVAIDAFRQDLGWHHWAVATVFFVFMVYSEGYRGFQQGFSPRVVARALYLYRHPRLLYVVVAPLYCMGFVHATPRRQRISLTIAAAIVGAVLAVRFVAQPWRGIIDLGVVAGLVWGIGALAVFGVIALGPETFSHSPEVPD